MVLGFDRLGIAEQFQGFTDLTERVEMKRQIDRLQFVFASLLNGRSDGIYLSPFRANADRLGERRKEEERTHN